MDKKHRKIQEKVQESYSKIKKAEKKLESVNFMWAPGHIIPKTKVCKICGEVISIDDDDISLHPTDGSITVSSSSTTVSNQLTPWELLEEKDES